LKKINILLPSNVLSSATVLKFDTPYPNL
jgi:hypothetical protein